MPKVVAIHQPNFFPWLGYFDKLARADVFIIMDNAQFPKTGGSWSNRVRLAIGGEARWVTMPIIRSYHGLRTCREMEINDKAPWRSTFPKTLRANYGRAPHFDDALALVEQLLAEPTTNLTEFNLTAIRTIAARLELDTDKIVIGTELDTEGRASDLLISMVKAIGGSAYLCGGGAAGYQEDHQFAAAGLDLIYQDFRHPVYVQAGHDRFIPGLSILDALMNIGFAGTSALLRQSK